MYNLLEQQPQGLTQQQVDAIAHIKEVLDAISPIEKLQLMPMDMGIKGQATDVCLIAKSQLYDVGFFVSIRGDVWRYDENKRRLRGIEAALANILPA